MNTAKKQKPKHRSSQLRESQRAHDADTYREGFQDGYKLGLAEGKREAVGVTVKTLPPIRDRYMPNQTR